jgi:hypothetical protein
VENTGSFGESMSAAARPKRWAVGSRQSQRSKIRSHQARIFHPTYLTGRANKGNKGNRGRYKKQKHKSYLRRTASDGSELVPTTDVNNTLTLCPSKYTQSLEMREMRLHS